MYFVKKMETFIAFHPKMKVFISVVFNDRIAILEFM